MIKKLFFFFLAFFATNFIFSQTRETVIAEDINGKTVYRKVENPAEQQRLDDYYSDELPPQMRAKYGAEEILQNMPMQDQLKLKRYFLKKCPECPQISRPVIRNPVTKPLVPPAPTQKSEVPTMINIINGTPGSIVVNKDGSVRVESYPVIQNGVVQLRVDTVYLLNPPRPPAFGSGTIPLMPANPSVGQNQFMFIWLLIGGLVAIIALALSGRLNTNQMH